MSRSSIAIERQILLRKCLMLPRLFNKHQFDTVQLCSI